MTRTKPSTARTLLLLPPAKGKAPDGDGPAYPGSLEEEHPLTEARRALLAALRADLPTLDDGALARVAGVRTKDVDAARAELQHVEHASTLPAHQRYRGIVHGNAGLPERDPAHLDVDVRVVSALAGLVAPEEPLPPYRLEFAASLPSLGGLATWWRDRAASYLGSLVEGRLVWDVLPGEHARIWRRDVREQADVVEVAFVRPDGRAANAARTKVCKGRLVAFLMDHPGADVEDVVRDADPGDGWKLTSGPAGLVATFTG